MINVTVGSKNLQTHKVDAYCFVVAEGQPFAGCANQAEQWIPSLAQVMEQREFSGKAGSIFSMPATVDGKIKELIFVGVGKQKYNKPVTVETMRRAVGKAIRRAVALRLASTALVLPDPQLFAISSKEMVEQALVTVHMAAYHFNEFITEEKRKDFQLVDLVMCGDFVGDSVLEETIARANTIGYAVNKARLWIDLPPSMLTPPHLADKAQDIASKHNLKITVFGEKEIIKMGMGGLAAVSRGSDEECRLVIMEYKAPQADAPTVAFVGKGITFDSGGLSLKPAQYMETMKEDMSGAAAVISSMEAIAKLKPAINVLGVAALSENLPSGKATKPGDIITFYNGKTAEVKNTDAEGRLVLADALSYTVKHYKPDAIIDLATLTGACAHALGPYYTGMMSEHDDLVARLQTSADRSGDRVWRLPLGDDYRAAIKSPVADICNIGSNKIRAGATTAGHFLQNFVDDTPWVHLDIAGTAFDVPNIPYYREGATGVGVRLIIDMVSNWL